MATFLVLLHGRVKGGLIGGKLGDGDGGHGKVFPPHSLSLLLGQESKADHLLLLLSACCGGRHQRFLPQIDKDSPA